MRKSTKCKVLAIKRHVSPTKNSMTLSGANQENVLVVKSVQDGVPVPLGLTFLRACAPLPVPAGCVECNRHRRAVPAKPGLHVNSIRRSFRPPRASVPPVAPAFSRKTHGAGSPRGAEVDAVQPRNPSL